MVPQSELNRRIAVLQEKMQTQEIDGALLAQHVAMYYFSGTMQCQYIYIPAQGKCLGLARRNIERAKKEAGIEIEAFASFKDLPNLLPQNTKSLGLEFDVLPVAVYNRLQKALQGFDFKDVSTYVRETRQVKSAYEFEQLNLAASQINEVYELIPQFITEGMEELHLAARLEEELRKRGHQGIGRMRGLNQEMFFGHLLSGPEAAYGSFVDSPTGGIGLSPAHPYNASRRKIRRGEPINIDYSGIHNGYCIDQTRLFSIGGLPDILNHAHAVALSIQEALLPLLKEGTTGAEIFEKAKSIAQKEGLSEHFMGYGDAQVSFVGHGLGLEFNEFPILAKNSPHVLQENMVVALEPKFTFPGFGVVGIENTWQITKSGVHKISLTPDNWVRLE